MFVEKHIAQHLVNRLYTILVNHSLDMEMFYSKKFEELKEDESFNDQLRKLFVIRAKELALDTAYLLLDQSDDYNDFVEQINKITDAQLYLE